MIQIGVVYTTLCQREGILLQKYHDRNGRYIAILFKVLGSGVDLTELINMADNSNRSWPQPTAISESQAQPDPMFEVV